MSVTPLNAELVTHRQRILDQGYTVCAGAMDDGLMSRIRTELAPWLGGRNWGRNNFEGERSERVYALLAKSPACAELVEHPLALGLANSFLCPDYLLSAALAINVHGGETPQNFHVDDNPAGAPQTAAREMWGLSTIWVFDEFTETNGATEVIPGSHRWGPERRPKDNEAVKVKAEAGSVLIFAGNLLHRGGANRGQSIRLAITIQYCQPWLRTIENMPLAVPPELAARYSARVQGLLGYSVVAPGFTGYVDGMHPKRLIDRAYKGRRERGLERMGKRALDLPPDYAFDRNETNAR